MASIGEIRPGKLSPDALKFEPGRLLSAPAKQGLKVVCEKLKDAHKAAENGCTIRSGGAKYGNASVHFAMLLRDELSRSASGELGTFEDQIGELMWGFTGDAFANCGYCRAVIAAGNELCMAPYLTGTTGVPDLGSILCAVAYRSEKWKQEIGKSVGSFDPEAESVRGRYKSAYADAMRRFQTLLAVIQYQWVTNNDFVDTPETLRLDAARKLVDGELERLTFRGSCGMDDDEAVPNVVRDNIRTMKGHIMPTPAAVVALVGAKGGLQIQTAYKLKRFVQDVHALLLEEPDVVQYKKIAEEEKTNSFYLNLHLRYFLWNVAPQLSLAMVRCDRIPALGPWYAYIILAVRAYALAGAIGILTPLAVDPDSGERKDATRFKLEPSELKVDGMEDEWLKLEVECTYWLLRILALPARSTLLRMPSALESLLSPQTRSSYEPLPGQDGAYWVLLRAVLSGQRTKTSKLTAMYIMNKKKHTDAMVARFAALLLLMRTRASVVMLLVDVGATDEDPIKDPISRDEIKSRRLSSMFKKLAFVTMPPGIGAGEAGVADQSVFEMITTFVSGSSDLEFLTSKRAVFIDNEIMKLVAEEELSIRSAQTKPAWPETDFEDEYSGKEDFHQLFVDQFYLVAKEWIKTCRFALGLPQKDGDKRSNIDTFRAFDQMKTGGFGSVVSEKNPFKMVESLLERLNRVAASHARSHCDEWLQMAFQIAVDVENLRFDRDGVLTNLRHKKLYLIRPVTSKKLAVSQEAQDAAWLRLYLRREVERVLHWSRHQGMWKTGNHRVLVGWFSTEVGPRMFARALTLHTTESEHSRMESNHTRGDAWLLDEKLLAGIRTRGEDSVMCAALRFSEELQTCLRAYVLKFLNASAELRQASEGNVDEMVKEAEKFRNSLELADLFPGQKVPPKTEEEKEAEVELTKEALRELSELKVDPTDDLPCILDSQRQRRMQAAVIHSPERWQVPAMDEATNTAMALFLRVNYERNNAVKNQVHVCQNKFKHGCCVAMLSFPAMADDVKGPYVENKTSQMPKAITKKAKERELAEEDYVAKPHFKEWDLELQLNRLPYDRLTLLKIADAMWFSLKTDELSEVTCENVADALQEKTLSTEVEEVVKLLMRVQLPPDELGYNESRETPSDFAVYLSLRLKESDRHALDRIWWRRAVERGYLGGGLEFVKELEDSKQGGVLV